MACCSASATTACSCSIVGDGTTTTVTGTGTIAQPFIVHATLTTGPTGATGATGAAGASNDYFPQAGVITTLPRNDATQTYTVSNQNGSLVGFVAPVTITIGHATFYVNTASATITSSQVALYSVDASGNLTQVAATAASTTLLNATGKVTVAFASGATLIGGNAYALSVYFNGTTMPVVGAALTTATIAGVVPIGTTGVIQPFYHMRTPSSTSVPGTSILYSTLVAASINPIYAELSA